MRIASYIEHTQLKPTITQREIDHLISEAIENHFLGVCVPPFWVKYANRERGTAKILLVTVAGFPLGYQMTETKIEEIKTAIKDGADEIDMVLNLSAFKSNLPWVKIELAKCATLVHDHQKILKVIIETAYLSRIEIENACRLCADTGVDFVKTSTGFAPQGAQIEKIEWMRNILPSTVGIKASGGIKTYQQAVEIIKAGAERIGTSSGINILAEENH